ncbi:hypothetical protein ES703_53645 [subsurface metagenome]
MCRPRERTKTNVLKLDFRRGSRDPLHTLNKRKKMEQIESNWYLNLFNDLKKLEFSIIIQKWKIGERIFRDIYKFRRQEYGSKNLDNLAQDLHVSTSSLYHCIQFYKRFKNYNDIINLRNYSWFYIVHNFLSENLRESDGRKKQGINEQSQKFIAEKLNLWRKGDSKFKEAVEQDAKDKIKLYRLLLNSIKEEKN